MRGVLLIPAKIQETSMEIDTVIGDTAYSEKDNIQYTKEKQLELASKLNPMITQGNRGKNQKETYYFDIDICKQCPLKDGCYKEGGKSKRITI